MLTRARYDRACKRSGGNSEASASAGEGVDSVSNRAVITESGIDGSVVRMNSEEVDELTGRLGEGVSEADEEGGSRIRRESITLEDDNLLETSERGITSDDKVDKMLMLVQGLLSGMKEERDSRRNTVLDKGRMVDRILPYREGSNISHFLLTFEAELKDIGVNKSEYRHILILKLPSKTKESVLDLMGSGACM